MIFRHISGFRLLLWTVLGLAVTIVLALLVAQATFLGPRDFSETLRSHDVRSAIVLSVLSATFSASLALLLAIPTGYALARLRFRGMMLLDTLLDVPVLLSPIALGLALLLVFRSAPGRWIENNILGFVFEVPGILLAQFILALALEIRVIKTAFEEVDPRLEQVALCLGCSQGQAFRWIALPLIRPGILTAFVLGWCRAIGDFGASVMIAGAVPGRTETIPIAIYLNLASVRIGQAVMLALVLTGVALSGLLIVRWVSSRQLG